MPAPRACNAAFAQSSAPMLPPMPLRLRKLIGTIVLFVLVISWSLLAMAVAQFPVIPKANGRLVEFVYYVVAGLGWVLPAMPLVCWMLTADPSAQATLTGRKPFHSPVAAPEISTLA